MTASDAVRRLLDDARLELPEIGRGDTRHRWRALAAIARENVSTARLAEAHVDAVQILHEAGRTTASTSLLGVWASNSPGHELRAERLGTGFRLRGSKAFCTGAGIVDAALVTADTDDGSVLCLVPSAELADGRIDRSIWRAHALADTSTAVVDFEGIDLPDDARIGAPGWYLERAGFWHGAIGPAACWAGAAHGLVDEALRASPSDAHGLAHRGALAATAWMLGAILDAAGDAADADPTSSEAARERALVVRHLVDDACRDIQDRFGRLLGPRAFVHDPATIERFDALTIYRRQCHAERDLEALGRVAGGRS